MPSDNITFQDILKAISDADVKFFKERLPAYSEMMLSAEQLWQIEDAAFKQHTTVKSKKPFDASTQIMLDCLAKKNYFMGEVVSQIQFLRGKNTRAFKHKKPSKNPTQNFSDQRTRWYQEILDMPFEKIRNAINFIDQDLLTKLLLVAPSPSIKQRKQLHQALEWQMAHPDPDKTNEIGKIAQSLLEQGYLQDASPSLLVRLAAFELKVITQSLQNPSLSDSITACLTDPTQENLDNIARDIGTLSTEASLQSQAKKIIKKAHQNITLKGLTDTFGNANERSIESSATTSATGFDRFYEVYYARRAQSGKPTPKSSFLSFHRQNSSRPKQIQDIFGNYRSFLAQPDDASARTEFRNTLERVIGEIDKEWNFKKSDLKGMCEEMLESLDRYEKTGTLVQEHDAQSSHSMGPLR